MTDDSNHWRINRLMIRNGRLTERQMQILALIACGHETAEIARTLALSRSTVKNHLGRIYEQLGARNRAHAVMIGLRCGLIKPGSDDP